MVAEHRITELERAKTQHEFDISQLIERLEMAEAKIQVLVDQLRRL